jgi:hypothetical protein
MKAHGVDHFTPTPERDDDAVCEMGRRWVAGFNRRDADALIELAHSEIEFHPTFLAGARRTYHGHAGLRVWLEDVAATNSQHKAEANVVRSLPSGDLVISGNVVVDQETVSPFSMRFCMKEEKFIKAWAYLSDETLLTSLGRLEPK